MKAKFGIIGLGTMGRNFLLNVADSGFSCAGLDLDQAKVDLLNDEGKEFSVKGYSKMSDFVESLEAPGNIMLLVPAGPIVDSILAELSQCLPKKGLMIDGGNSYFADTDRREVQMTELGFEYLGVGVSGGADGARKGPSIMVGGNPTSYERVRPIFEAVSAHVDDQPCAALVGRGSAGHFVKMVHNGIEYGMMQLISEAYDLMKRGLEMDNGEIADTFGEWNSGELNSFLIEITEKALRKKDEDTQTYLVDKILDTAGQKGTGKWTSQIALDMGIPVPTIDAAVTMRQISAQKPLREEAAGILKIVENKAIVADEKSEVLEVLRKGLFVSFVATYSQGFELLQEASKEESFGLDIAQIATIWRGGCIIRAKLLESVRQIYTAEPSLKNLLFSLDYSREARESYNSLIRAIGFFNDAHIPSMAFSASFAYLTALNTPRLPANLIQAQRDFFGAHTYQRIDKTGTFTTQWEKS